MASKGHAFGPVLKVLREAGVSGSLIFPARVCVKHKDSISMFDSPEEGWKFADSTRQMTQLDRVWVSLGLVRVDRNNSSKLFFDSFCTWRVYLLYILYAAGKYAHCFFSFTLLCRKSSVFSPCAPLPSRWWGNFAISIGETAFRLRGISCIDYLYFSVYNMLLLIGNVIRLFC